jgi:hypothetical protein
LDLISSSSSPSRKTIFFLFNQGFSIIGSRSPNRYLRSRDRFIRSYDKTEFGDRGQRADQLLADFEDILLQINGDFRSKEENLHSPTPVGIQTESLPADFTYVRSFSCKNFDTKIHY